jgi:uncharacterized protein (TIGR02001 family)
MASPLLSDEVDEPSGEFMNLFKISLIASFMAVLSLRTADARLSFGGNATLVSSYVFRGVRQFNGAALQGAAEIRWRDLTGGFWSSNVEFGNDWSHETDLYVEIALPAGSVPATLGLMAYSYDFNKFNAASGREFEAYGTVAFRDVSAGLYMVPPQQSTKNDPAGMNYWIEVSWGRGMGSMEWSFGYAFGTYSSRFLPDPRKDAVGVFSVSASRKIIDSITLSWNAALPATPALDNQFFMSLAFTF